MPGPNDFHVESGVLRSGLGPDEPSVESRKDVAAATAELKAREEMLAQMSADVRNEARSLEERKAEIERTALDLKSRITADFDTREAELQAREAALAAREAAATPNATDLATRRSVATERADASPSDQQGQ